MSDLFSRYKNRGGGASYKTLREVHSAVFNKEVILRSRSDLVNFIQGLENVDKKDIDGIADEIMRKNAHLVKS